MPTTFQTANGERSGRAVDRVEVSVGQMCVTNAKVGVGLNQGDHNQALLGQSFLFKFDISLSQNQMGLRTRSQCLILKMIAICPCLTRA